VLNDNEVMKKKVAKQFPQGLPVVDLLTLFPSFSETVAPYSFLDGTSSPLDMAMLRALAKRFPACRYFEIGTWRGESVANVAAVAKECITLNLPDNEMRKMGLPEEYISLHRFFSKNLTNVQHLQHHSSSFDFNSIGKFDLIFVDGDHHYEQVKKDTANVFTMLKDESSIIVWHDYLDANGQIRYEVMAGLLHGCPGEFRPNLYHVSNTMCAIFITKKLSSESAHSFSNPDKIFNISISAKRL